MGSIWGGQVADDRIEERVEVGSQCVGLVAGTLFERPCVDNWKFRLLVGGAQVDKQVEGGVDNIVGAGGWAVDLVDDDDGRQAALEGLPQHKAGLGHRSLDGIDQQQHAVDHMHDAFDLPTKIGVAGRIDNVDGRAAVLDAGVFGQNGDPSLAFEVVGIHHAFDNCLVVTEDFGLA